MKFIRSAIFIIAVLSFSIIPIFAQESEAVVIDEVIAQINDGVLTLSRVKRESKEVIEGLIQEGKKPEEAKALVDGKQGEIIAGLIIEELILQKGKEEGIDSEVEIEVNKRFLSIMKQEKMTTLDALYKAMESQGVRPDDYRELWRKQISRDIVMQREVDGKVYWSLSTKELRDYFEKNKAKFTKPETVTLSEIFLNLAGRDKATLMEKAKQIVAELRKGGDFEKLAVENSDRPNVKENKGKVGTFTIADLNEKLSTPIKSVKAGEVSDPIDVEDGIEILKVVERSEASSESFFDEDAVRKVLAYEKIPEARKKFLADLRKDAFIKVSEGYRAIVLPFLNKDEVTAEVKKGK